MGNLDLATFFSEWLGYLNQDVLGPRRIEGDRFDERFVGDMTDFADLEVVGSNIILFDILGVGGRVLHVLFGDDLVSDYESFHFLLYYSSSMFI